MSQRTSSGSAAVGGLNRATQPGLARIRDVGHGHPAHVPGEVGAVPQHLRVVNAVGEAARGDRPRQAERRSASSAGPGWRCRTAWDGRRPSRGSRRGPFRSGQVRPSARRPGRRWCGRGSGDAPGRGCRGSPSRNPSTRDRRASRRVGDDRVDEVGSKAPAPVPRLDSALLPRAPFPDLHGMGGVGDVEDAEVGIARRRGPLGLRVVVGRGLQLGARDGRVDVGTPSLSRSARSRASRGARDA